MSLLLRAPSNVFELQLHKSAAERSWAACPKRCIARPIELHSSARGHRSNLTVTAHRHFSFRYCRTKQLMFPNFIDSLRFPVEMRFLAELTGCCGQNEEDPVREHRGGGLEIFPFFTSELQFKRCS